MSERLSDAADRLSGNKIHNFVSHLKTTVDELGLASQAIDSEFAAI